MTRILCVATLAALATSATGCMPEDGAPAAGDARTVELRALDFRYDPATIEATPGEPLRVVLRNDGQSPHNVEFELPDGEVEIEEDVPPGGEGEVGFEAPVAPGDYVFYCPVANHHDQGMEGTLVVGDTDTGPAPM